MLERVGSRRDCRAEFFVHKDGAKIEGAFEKTDVGTTSLSLQVKIGDKPIIGNFFTLVDAVIFGKKQDRKLSELVILVQFPFLFFEIGDFVLQGFNAPLFGVDGRLGLVLGAELIEIPL